MTNQEKIAMLEDMMELEKGTLQENGMLSDVVEWNSLAKLSFIALMDETFGKKVSADEMKQFKSVKDILNFMG
jgi:acyl carrier protein